MNLPILNCRYQISKFLYSNYIYPLLNNNFHSGINQPWLIKCECKNLSPLSKSRFNHFPSPRNLQAMQNYYTTHFYKVTKEYLGVTKKYFSTSVCTNRSGIGFGDRTGYEHTRKGLYAKENRSNLENFREGVKELKGEFKKLWEEVKQKVRADPIFVRPGDTDKVLEFKTPEDFKKWLVTSDKDHGEGSSTGSLTVSPTGHGLFSGEICLEVPKDGKIGISGYCNASTVTLRKSFKREMSYDWMMYTHLVMRVRGDGRRYLITLKTSGNYDITWNDLFIYVLHTRGGPYWQEVKIPFSKFVFSNRGKIQDKQFALPKSMVKTIGITARDRINASFWLEIDYIGVHCDPSHTEEFAYEMYRVPDFLV